MVGVWAQQQREAVVTWACTARWKAPRLKGSMEPLWFLVPSGKTQTRTWEERCFYGGIATWLWPLDPIYQFIYNCSTPYAPFPSSPG